MTTSSLDCPADFQPLPDTDLLSHVAPDTRFVHAGDNHLNLFGRVWTYNAIPQIAVRFENFALEARPRDKDAINFALDELSDDPAQLQAPFLPKSKKPNYFSNVTLCPYSLHAILFAARASGMALHCIDDDYGDYDVFSYQGKHRRNQAMAHRLADLGDAFHFGGIAHLYDENTPEGRIDSVPSVLCDLTNTKTHAVTMEAYREGFLKRLFEAENTVGAADKNALVAAFMTNGFDAARARPVSFNFHPSSTGAGKALPDDAVVFSEKGAA